MATSKVDSLSALPACDVVTLDRGPGTHVRVHLHGATVLSWICNDEEQLFLSSCSVFDNKKAIRGGIPLVFPNFGPWSLGPQHGFARIKRWTLHTPPEKMQNGNVRAEFLLEDDESTRQMWNFKFRVVYGLELTEDSLVCTMTVTNSGSSAFDFTCLLHTYLRVPDISGVKVKGLKGLTYVDKIQESKEFTENRDLVTLESLTDRVYKNSPDTVVVHSGGSKGIELTTSNFTDTVVWNPFEQKAKEMGDFDDDGWHYMICVEAGRVSTPVSLPSGGRFECRQTLRRFTQ